MGQNIFHRPANSGIYAFVGNLEIARLGLNDVTKNYPINDEERGKRYRALLKSVLYTFIKPTGAMRNTQNPHITNFEGMISYSTSTCPAPTISALNYSYKEEIMHITNNLNRIVDNSIETYEVISLSEFTEKIADLIQNTKPYKLN